MSVRLTVTQRSEAGSAATPVEHVLDEASITLGRDKSCQVVLAQQAVSRNHARISQEGNLFFLEDLGSAYGTQINGKALPKGEKHRLRNGDVIAIAQFDVRFDHVADLPNLNQGSEKTSFVARSLVKDVMRGIKSGEGPYFRIMNGPREGERIEISDAQEIYIGRDETADVIFKDDLVSRRHVKIRRDWSGTHVEDQNSRNGIKVNKKKVNRKTLKDSDELEVGSTRLLYVDPSDMPDPSVVIPDEPVDEGGEDEHTESLPAAKGSSASKRAMRARANTPPPDPEPPKVEAPKVEEPAPEPVAAEPPPPEPEPEPAPEPPMPMREPPMPDEPVESGSSKIGPLDKKNLLPLALLGLFALFAIGLIIALFAGA
jgi:pSer/pThr/pTyr-binding forkhead associated (FHA) protein